MPAGGHNWWSGLSRITSVRALSRSTVRVLLSLHSQASDGIPEDGLKLAVRFEFSSACILTFLAVRSFSVRCHSENRIQAFVMEVLWTWSHFWVQVVRFRMPFSSSHLPKSKRYLSFTSDVVVCIHGYIPASPLGSTSGRRTTTFAKLIFWFVFAYCSGEAQELVVDLTL
jgi:hypothetical protein